MTVPSPNLDSLRSQVRGLARRLAVAEAVADQAGQLALALAEKLAPPERPRLRLFDPADDSTPHPD